CNIRRAHDTRCRSRKNDLDPLMAGSLCFGYTAIALGHPETSRDALIGQDGLQMCQIAIDDGLCIGCPSRRDSAFVFSNNRPDITGALHEQIGILRLNGLLGSMLMVWTPVRMQEGNQDSFAILLLDQILCRLTYLLQIQWYALLTMGIQTPLY